MMRHLKLVLVITALPALLGGCAAPLVASGSPEWDAQFGERVRILQAQQLIDAQAPVRNAQTIPASDGRNTRDAMDRLGESYRSPPPTNVINIGVGGGGG